MHTLCRVRRSCASDVVYLAPDVLYWPKKILGLGWSRAFWDGSPGFPDDKSLPGHSSMIPVHLYCVQQPTSTDLETSLTPGLQLQVSSVVGVLFPRRRSSLGSARSLNPHKKINQITLIKIDLKKGGCIVECGCPRALFSQARIWITRESDELSHQSNVYSHCDEFSYHVEFTKARGAPARRIRMRSHIYILQVCFL